MSGNTISLGLAIGRGDVQRAMLIAGIIGAFTTGAVAGGLLSIALGRFRLPGVVAAVAAILVLPIALPPTSVHTMAFAMGVLNAALDHAGSVGVSLTYITGALVKFARGLAARLWGRGTGLGWLQQVAPWFGILGGPSRNRFRGQHATRGAIGADVRSTTARLSFATVDARRYDDLAAKGAGTVKNKQQADTSLSTSTANLQSAEARLGAAHQDLAKAEAQLKAANATVALDEARVRQAGLNLSYTRIAAPVDGMVAARSVQVGDYVAAGTTLMTIVPLEDVYIDANYREVQLSHVAKGQPVDIHVDVYDTHLEGIVVGVPAASGTTFAPIQPDNATGNFTKIVQRLPVRIAISPDQPKAAVLRVGMSVETTIRTGLADVAPRAGDTGDAHEPVAIKDR